jgi:hypothetical protein
MTRIEKQPAERIPIGVDFTPNSIPSGFSLTNASSVTVARVSDGKDVTAQVLISGSVAVSGNVVTGTFRGGTNGQKYRLTFTGRTDGSPSLRYEEDVMLVVLNKP